MSAVRAGNSCKKSNPKKLDPLSACLQKSYRHSGMKSATRTLATVSSGLTATTRCGGHVTSAQTPFLMSGRRLLTRSNGKGCPFCSGISTCQHNTLARKAPQVVQFWDAKKNHPLSPDQVTVFSNMRVHWKCSVCTYEWQARVTEKTRGNTGCPKCAKANGSMRADGTRQKHPTFAKAKHALLEQWDHDRNRENGDFPDNTTLHSRKLIWWRCHECPVGKEHSWQAPPSGRNSHKKATGCPFCVGRRICECNSLEAICPDIAADFDIQKNGVSAAEVTNSSASKYSWLSDEPGAKKRSVDQRTSHAKRKSSQLLDAPDV